ncbi:MAG: AbrB/MazE/SpoVT family DNA-binding domain-containing protein [Acidimicrobiia bacterium]|nr:AbrB/MazE/SpoVT family DNA-binding domain-containing protein [Acidimicrobiia bacterium]
MDTGMVRKIDDLGRIVVPAETRRLFNINEGDSLAISVEGDSILVRKLDATCTFCGSTTGVSNFKDKGLCSECRSEISGPAS